MHKYYQRGYQKILEFDLHASQPLARDQSPTLASKFAITFADMGNSN